MKLSEFWTNMDYEFGAGSARVLAGDLVRGSLGTMTALEALEAGVAPKDVWLAVCETQDIPEVRRLGPDREPRR